MAETMQWYFTYETGFTSIEKQYKDNEFEELWFWFMYEPINVWFVGTR